MINYGLKVYLLILLDMFFNLASLFILGMSPYFFLFYGGYLSKKGSWGNTFTISGFLTHVLRREYGTFSLFAGGNKTDIGDNLINGLYLFISTFQKVLLIIIGNIIYWNTINYNWNIFYC